MQHAIISAQNVNKSFMNENREIEILHSLSFEIQKGETVSITGPSGSGKTTLLGLLAGLDTLTSGSILIDGEPMELMNEDQRSKLRLHKMGFVFQNFQLLPNLTASENVMVPLELLGDSKPNKKAQELLAQVGLANRGHHYPTQLSGGEQQRVAIARAFAHNPILLMADEPTGNLDEETSDNIEKLLFELNSQKGTTLVIVTHDLELAAKTNRILKLKGGRLEY
ncbi:MAG: ABC transporter ATP-binding protein [Bacteroidia bacterium]